MNTKEEDANVGTDVPNYGAAAVAAQIAGEPLEGSYGVREEGFSANTRQVGGSHYKNNTGVQHWDLVHMLGMDYFTAQITRYLSRAHRKNGKEDYAKAVHYIDKRTELGIDYVLTTEYRGPDGRIHLTHVLLWDFCQRQDMPLMAVRAFFTLLNGDADGARGCTRQLEEQAELAEQATI